MNLFLLAAIGVGILMYGVLRGLEAIIRYQRDQNRSWLLRLDPDAGTYDLERRRINSNQIRNEKDGKTEILEGQARYTGDKGSLFMLHARHGWNLFLRAPTDAETVGADKRLQTLAICNPASYYQAEKRNDAQDALAANQEPEPWYGRLAVPIMIVGVAALATLGWIAVTLARVT